MGRHAVHSARALAALVFCLVACEAGENSDGVIRTDSAGVQIVQNGDISDLPITLRIAEEHALDLGGMRNDPDQELDATAPFLNAVTLSDKRFVVSDNRNLKLFASNGDYLLTIGRAGSGPGEFGQVRAVCVAPGDTIIAIHYSAPRVSVFDNAGGHVRTFSVRANYIEGSACLDDGSVLAHTESLPNPASTLPPEAATVLDRVSTIRRFARTGEDMGAVGVFEVGGVNFYFPTVPNVIPHRRDIYVGDGQIPEGPNLQRRRVAPPDRPVADRCNPGNP